MNSYVVFGGNVNFYIIMFLQKRIPLLREADKTLFKKSSFEIFDYKHEDS